MKKYLLLLILTVATTVLYGQTTYYTTRVSTAILNKKTNTWKWSPKKEVEIKITIADDDIYFDNEAQTHVHLTSDMATLTIKGGTQYKWFGIDEEKIRCSFSIVSWDDGSPVQYYLSYADIKACYTMAPPIE